MTCCSVNDWVIGNQELYLIVEGRRGKRESGWKSIRWTDVRYDISSLTLLLFTWPILPTGLCSLLVSVIKLKQVLSGRKRSIFGVRIERKETFRGREDRETRERERACRRRKLRFFHYFSSLIFLPLLPFPFFILSLISFLFPLSVTPL